MRLIINCDPEALPAAMKIVNDELKQDWQKRYDKPGWGWHFSHQGQKFFVRGIKGGLSVTQTKTDPK